MSTEATQPLREEGYAIHSFPLYTTTMVNKRLKPHKRKEMGILTGKKPN